MVDDGILVGDPDTLARLCKRSYADLDDALLTAPRAGRGPRGGRWRRARARAARDAGADWIFFIDADDLMTPRAFSIFSRYADQFDAVWGLMAI